MSISTGHTESTKPMNLEEATKYLKKIHEWESVCRLDRDTVLKWAEFLKNREITQESTNKKVSPAKIKKCVANS